MYRQMHTNLCIRHGVQTSIIIRYRGTNPVVVVSKNHPSSPKEAPSLYEEEEEEEDGQSSRDCDYCAEDALRGAEISRHRDRQ